MGRSIAWLVGSLALTFLKFFMWSNVKIYIPSVHIQSLSQVNERLEQATAAVSNKTLQEVWKNKISRNIHNRKVIGRHIKQHKI